jgi:hypothetical protein
MYKQSLNQVMKLVRASCVKFLIAGERAERAGVAIKKDKVRRRERLEAVLTFA